MDSVSPLSELPTASVLLIEDDPGFRFALRESLERAGLTVHAASSGREALAQREAEARVVLDEQHAGCGELGER